MLVTRWFEHAEARTMFKTLEAVAARHPSLGVLENVMGLASSSREGENTPLSLCIEKLAELGYSCRPVKICMSSFVNMTRERTQAASSHRDTLKMRG
eukprot:6470868-Amphidinium_carterae.3